LGVGHLGDANHGVQGRPPKNRGMLTKRHELRKHRAEQVNQPIGGAAWLSRTEPTKWMETGARAGCSARPLPTSNAPTPATRATATATAAATAPPRPSRRAPRVSITSSR